MPCGECHYTDGEQSEREREKEGERERKMEGGRERTRKERNRGVDTKKHFGNENACSMNSGVIDVPSSIPR